MRRTCKTNRLNAKLNEELRKLQRLLNDGHDLKVVWSPGQNPDLDGEVTGNTVHIYCRTFEQTLKCLRHEFLDYIISGAIEPYKEVTNSLIALLNKRAYGRKEKLVEKLANSLSQCGSGCQGE